MDPHARDRRIRLAALGMAVVLLSPGCATNPAGQAAADQETCAKLVAAVKTALDTGSAPLDAETAAFARARGLGDNLVADAGDGGATFVPKSLPFPLMAAAEPRDGGPRYRAAVASLTPEYVRQLASEGRRCEWQERRG